MVGVDVEATLGVLDDLTRPTIAGGKGWQAAGHGLNHGQAKRLVQGRLQQQHKDE